MKYQVDLYNPDGQLVAVLDGWTYLRYRRVVNGTAVFPSEGRNVLPLLLRYPWSTALQQLMQPDSSLAIWRDGRLEMETVWLIRRVSVLVEGGRKTLEVAAVPALAVLSRVVAYAAASAQAFKVGPADDVIKAIVRENLSGLVTDADRLLARLVVAADLSAAPVVSIACAWREVATALAEVVYASGQRGTKLAFDVVWEGAGFRFRTYTVCRGNNRTVGVSSNPLILSLETGTLDEVRREFDYEDEATVVYAGGRGVEAERMVAVVMDTSRIISPLGRREVFVDARHLADPVSLGDYARAALERRRPRRVFRAKVVSTEVVRYGRHWQWGDLVTVHFHDEAFDCAIGDVTVTVEDGVEQVNATLLADVDELQAGAALSETEHTYQQIQTTVVQSGQVLTLPGDGQLVAYRRYEVVGSLVVNANSQLVILM